MPTGHHTPDPLHAGRGCPDDAAPVGGPYSLRSILAWVGVWLGLFAGIQHPGYISAFYEPRAVLHYYLGAKYFNEIGPFDLYGCVFAADGETTNIWAADTPVRDLHDYTLVPAIATSCPRERFSAERWTAFLRDVSWITGTATPADFALALTDKGYNATPFFSRVFGQVIDAATLVRANSTRWPFIVFNLDLIFVAIAVWIVFRSAGATIALLVLVFGLGFFGNFGRIGGNLAQYVWFPCLTASVAAWRARRPAAGGAALGLAAGFHVFPAFFAFPVVVSGMRSIVRGDRDGWMRSLVFCVSLVVVIGSCVAIGSASPRGFDAWRTWRQKMAIHSAYLRGEVFDIGLSNVLGDALSGDHASSDSYEQDIPHSLARRTAVGAHRWLWLLLSALLIGLAVAAVWSVPEQPAPAFGFVPIYALLALSPYYYLALALLPFMAAGIGRTQYKILVGALAVLFAANLAIWNGSYISFSFGWHAVTEGLIAAFMLLITLIPLLPIERRPAPVKSVEG
jgi:hypothetical protein